MANHTREKPTGWGLNEELSSPQITNLDIKIAQSVNGDGGGSYAGDQTWAGQHTFEAQGICLRFDSASLASSGTYQITAKGADVYQLANTPGGDVTVEVQKTTPVPIKGRIIRFHRPNTGVPLNQYIIHNGVGGPIILNMLGGSAIPASVELIWDGADWRLHSWAGDSAKFVFVNP